MQFVPENPGVQKHVFFKQNPPELQRLSQLYYFVQKSLIVGHVSDPVYPDGVILAPSTLQTRELEPTFTVILVPAELQAYL